MDIIKFIKEKVLEAGSQTAVARKTGVSQGTIAKICNGDTNPELGTIYKISSAYGIPPSRFLGNTDAVPGQFEAPAFERMAPVVSLAQAGDNGYWVGPYPETHGMDRVPYPSSIKDPNAFAVRVTGNSMIPRYYAGEIVICDTTKEVMNNSAPSSCSWPTTASGATKRSTCRPRTLI